MVLSLISLSSALVLRLVHWTVKLVHCWTNLDHVLRTQIVLAVEIEGWESCRVGLLHDQGNVFVKVSVCGTTARRLLALPLCPAL